MLTLIENVEVYAPEPIGRNSILILGDRIARIATTPPDDVRCLDVPLQHVNGSELIAIPGLVDPHQHLIGGSGELGFSTQTPEIFFSELVTAGITTVVGCLGVDTTTRTMPALLAKAKGLREQGISAYLWSGGYDVPPVTLTGSIKNDILFVEEIIGAGEIALSDRRSSHPDLSALAKLVTDVYNAGMLSRKAGVTHFHMGDGAARLSLLRELLERYPISPESLYPTHVERTPELFDEALELTTSGAYVDIDTFDQQLELDLKTVMQSGARLDRVTVSTDAAINRPGALLDGLRACVRSGLPLERVLPMMTSNTAGVLKLPQKGKISVGADADLLLLRRTDLQLLHVFARGKHLLADGNPTHREAFLPNSDRRIELHGTRK